MGKKLLDIHLHASIQSSVIFTNFPVGKLSSLIQNFLSYFARQSSIDQIFSTLRSLGIAFTFLFFFFSFFSLFPLSFTLRFVSTRVAIICSRVQNVGNFERFYTQDLFPVCVDQRWDKCWVQTRRAFRGLSQEKTPRRAVLVLLLLLFFFFFCSSP